MSVDYGAAHGARRRSWLSVLALPIIAFLAGIAAMGWLLTRWGQAAALIGVAPAPQPAAVAAAPAPASAPAPVAAAPAPGAETQRLVLDPETTRRVNQLEQRVTELDSQSRAAAGNADRAEGLLVAFAARRALDRGVPLGYIEGLLRQRFGETQRQAVATIITASRQPVTLQQLQDGLADIGPELTGVGPEQNWWTAFRAELGELVSIRRAGTPSTIPADRLRRAERALASGQVDVALAEVLRLPGRDQGAEWVADARRYVMARRALDRIETAALLEPRMPAPGAAADAATARRLRPA
ncbi:MAG TPA: hypothetical protein VF662_03740 [Allosphingosinicella sp.]|jgi:hypothetical protein